jgi:formylglycine-generating enzyme required for sulfatase activity
MFRQVSTVVVVVLVAVGSFTVGAAEPKEAGDKAKSPPKELTVNVGKGIKLEMVLIPAGEFLMGSPDSDKGVFAALEKPQHRVRITKPFYLGKFLVTQEQWESVMGGNPSRIKGARNPVEQVSWDDCQLFLGKLKAKVGDQGKFVLPTEAQWEYACRAGSTTRYCFGDDESKLGDYAWYDANSGGKTHPVGEKKPNAWGLFDMHGNVWERCQDWYGNYGAEAVTDPAGPATGSIIVHGAFGPRRDSLRVTRGGGFCHVAVQCRSASRADVSGEPIYNQGFRVAQLMADK